MSVSYWLKRFLDFSSFNHCGESSSLQKINPSKQPDSCTGKYVEIFCKWGHQGAGAACLFSFMPVGGSTRAARGRNGDLGERDTEGEGPGPLVWLSESLLFFSWAWSKWDIFILASEQAHHSGEEEFLHSCWHTFKAEGSTPGNRATLCGCEAMAGPVSAPLVFSSDSESSSLLSAFSSVEGTEQIHRSNPKYPNF